MEEIIIDTIVDALKLVPFLFVTYLIMEYVEHKTSNKLKNTIKKSGKFGPLIGGLLGTVPQCGFSVVATNLYATRIINLGTLIDACSCYVDINPKTKDIVLAYRYTDVIEIYNCKGELKYSLHGPECFDIKFRSNGVSMVKTKDTRKAYVNSYVTEKNIYLLYSGCKKNEANWANGTELYVFSWEGQPQKKYILDQPIYTFAVDEDRGVIYSYSIQKDELVKAYI